MRSPLELHPVIAAAFYEIPPEEVGTKVRRLVDETLQQNHVTVEDESRETLESLATQLDEAAWDVQTQDDEVGLDQYSTEYVAAFCKARAATALLAFVTREWSSAVYEALHALQGDEQRVLELLR